jgi:hypothetical protein
MPCPRWDSNCILTPANKALPPENLRNPAQSGTSSTRSEPQGVHIVHTPLFCLAAEALSKTKACSQSFGSLCSNSKTENWVCTLCTPPFMSDDSNAKRGIARLP